MESILEKCQDFNKNSVSDLLMKLDRAIDQYNDPKKYFTFTPHYRVDIAVTVAAYAYKKFIVKVEQLTLENDPIESMNRLKPIFFRTFETQFSEASNDQTAAQNLGNILRKPIEKALIEKLQIEIVNKMKLESSNFRKKNYFKVMVMEDLAKANDFNLFTDFLMNISASLKSWAKTYVKQYCEKKNENGNANLTDLSNLYLEVIMSEITSIIKKTSNFTGNIEINNTGDMDPSDDSGQHLDVKKWLETFHKNAKMIISIDQQETMEMIGVHSIHNTKFFTIQLVKYLQDESKAILLGFENISAGTERLTEIANSPHLVLYNSLIGCKEQCPFCKEQCELTDENHLKSKKPHYAEIHRPNCLGGYTHKEDNKLVFEICTKSVESDVSFKNADTKDVYIPYKEYKRFYPNWQISTEAPKTGPKFWEWFIATYNSEIVEWIEAAPSPVYSQGWQNITKEEAIDNLTETYGLNVDQDKK